MISHPERVLYPAIGLSRAELMLYYYHVAGPLLGHLQDRALTIRRWPHGILAPGFYQRYRYQSRHERYPIVVDSLSELLRWVGLGAIEFHSPLGRVGDGGLHDWAVIDLDPNPPADWAAVVRVARVTLDLLDRFEIPVSLKTSGARGLHLLVPIEPTEPHRAQDAIERVARVVSLALPEDATVARRVAHRGARVYIDYLQNGPRRTMAAVYSARAGPDARVSWPVGREDLDRGPEAFTVRSTLHRSVPFWPRVRPVPMEALLDREGLPTVEELRRLQGPVAEDRGMAAGIEAGRCV